MIPATRVVLFDLFGTLVPQFPRRAHSAILDECSRRVGLDPNIFKAAWAESYDARTRGDLGRFIDQLQSIATLSGVSVGHDALRATRRAYEEFVIGALTPFPEALRSIKRLRTNGLRLALVSNANPDVAAAWSDSRLARSLDVAIFSCDVGTVKPEPGIYAAALDALGEQPAKAVFVGDGSDDELAGAERFGIHAVLVRRDLFDAYDIDRPAVEAWTGPSITSLSELVTIAT